MPETTDQDILEEIQQELLVLKILMHSVDQYGFVKSPGAAWIVSVCERDGGVQGVEATVLNILKEHIFLHQNVINEYLDTQRKQA
jgi:hypothetical protein